MKTIIYLVALALAAMLILVPTALAQDAVEGKDDVLTAEREVMVVVVEHGDREQIAGQPLPSRHPTNR